MKDSRPKTFVKQLMVIRRQV